MPQTTEELTHETAWKASSVVRRSFKHGTKSKRPGRYVNRLGFFFGVSLSLLYLWLLFVCCCVWQDCLSSSLSFSLPGTFYDLPLQLILPRGIVLCYFAHCCHWLSCSMRLERYELLSKSLWLFTGFDLFFCSLTEPLSPFFLPATLSIEELRVYVSFWFPSVNPPFISTYPSVFSFWRLSLFLLTCIYM